MYGLYASLYNTLKFGLNNKNLNTFIVTSLKF